MNKELITVVKDEYDKIKSALTIVCPFISALLRKVRILLTEDVSVGATNGREIYLNPNYFQKLSWEGKAWIIAHELFHVAFLDIKRFTDKKVSTMIKWNIACDAVNNQLILHMLPSPIEFKEKMITIDRLYNEHRVQLSSYSRDEIMSMSKEELFSILGTLSSLLLDHVICTFSTCEKCNTDNVIIEVDGSDVSVECKSCGSKYKKNINDDVIHPGSIIEIDDFKPKDTVLLQEGDSEVYSKEEEKFSNAWKEEIYKAYIEQKKIGTVPFGLTRIVNELLKPKVDWRILLRQILRSGLGKIYISTYRRKSRKHPDLPGLKKFTNPTVHILVDTSGSISEEELTQFISEVHSICSSNKVFVYPFDARTYDIIEARSKFEVISKVLPKLKGGGGTEIADSLEKTIERINYMDIVVILTDGYIYDLDNDRTKQLLSTIARKASVCIFGTTKKEEEIAGWITVKI